MAFMKVIVLSLISTIMMFSSSYYSLFSLFSNFYIVRRLRVCYILLSNTKVILTTEKNLPDNLRKEYIFCTVLIILSCAFYGVSYLFFSDYNIDGSYLRQATINLQMFIITTVIWAVIFWQKKLTNSEVKYLSLVNNLTPGYGCAIWYYKNYLSRILPTKFNTGVLQYETQERIVLAKKLYILFPMSCKVQQYIDNTDNIENAKDLPSFEIDLGGIKKREYRVSVYRIESNEEYFHCALEFAQPLKVLLSLKEEGKITISEMYDERHTFIKNLKQMLKDRENSFEVCELVEYDDENEDIHTVLSSLASVQEYKIRTKE